MDADQVVCDMCVRERLDCSFNARARRIRKTKQVVNDIEEDDNDWEDDEEDNGDRNEDIKDEQPQALVEETDADKGKGCTPLKTRGRSTPSTIHPPLITPPPSADREKRSFSPNATAESRATKRSRVDGDRLCKYCSNVMSCECMLISCRSRGT